jgi:hypothetical protein
MPPNLSLVASSSVPVKALAAALALGLAAASLASAQSNGSSAAGFEVVGHVDPADGYSGDVWGHRGHAYLSSHRGRRDCPAQGVRVYSLARPSRPTLVSRFGDARSTPALRGTWTEKTIVRRVSTAGFDGDLAVSSVQACDPRSGSFQGFALYDVTRPARPRRLALVRTEPRGSHEIWLQANRGQAYVYTAIIASEARTSPDGRRPGKPDFRIFDVSRPERPREVGGWGAWRHLDRIPFRDPDDRLNGNFVHSVVTNAAGTRAFLSYWDLGTVILDIRDPRRPRYLGRTPMPAGVENAHSAWLAAGERVLVETHEDKGGAPTLYDISNPRTPRRLGELTLSNAVLEEGARGRLGTVSGLDIADSVHDPKVRGSIAFFSWYRQGLVAADISDPRAPRFLARFLPPEARDPEELFCPGEACTAFWGVSLLGDLVLASDMPGGLWVLRLRNA